MTEKHVWVCDGCGAEEKVDRQDLKSLPLRWVKIESFPAGSDAFFADCCSATCGIDVLKKQVVKRGELVDA